MSIETYSPGPADAQVQKGEGDFWTLVLVRELRHSPEKVWAALTDPTQLREWAPFDVDGSLAQPGTVKLNWVGSPAPQEATVKRAEAPKLLEYNLYGMDVRWQLEPSGAGTRLTLWHPLDRRYISMGAAGWHISLDVLDRMLDGHPIGRISGQEAMKFEGWKRLNKEYAERFGAEAPSW